MINQESDPQLLRTKRNLEKIKSSGLITQEDGTLRFHTRLCLSKNEKLRGKKSLRALTTPNIQCI